MLYRKKYLHILMFYLDFGWGVGEFLRMLSIAQRHSKKEEL